MSQSEHKNIQWSVLCLSNGKLYGQVKHDILMVIKYKRAWDRMYQ
jgi:hypothetical protein